MKQYIYRIQLRRAELLTEGPTGAEAEALTAHGDYLDRLTKSGDVLVAGRTQTTDPDGFGIVILAARSESVARDIMNNDPAVKQKVMRAEFFPYKIAFLSEPALGPDHEPD